MTDKVANPDHYTAFAIQPLEYAMANKLPFAEANIIKYVSRWRGKNGVEDLRKARSMLDKLIAYEETGSMHGAVQTAAKAGLTKGGCGTPGCISQDCAYGHAPTNCKPCGGTGAADVFAMEPCGDCMGTGRDYPDCSGEPEDCPRCKGSGAVAGKVAPTLDAAQTELVRKFVKAAVACAYHTGSTIASPKSYQAECFHTQAAAYNALPDFLKD